MQPIRGHFTWWQRPSGPASAPRGRRLGGGGAAAAATTTADTSTSTRDRSRSPPRPLAPSNPLTTDTDTKPIVQTFPSTAVHPEGPNGRWVILEERVEQELVTNPWDNIPWYGGGYMRQRPDQHARMVRRVRQVRGKYTYTIKCPSQCTHVRICISLEQRGTRT